MPADAYAPDQWSAFFTMVGGGVAALTGLVFVALSVALSINVEQMTRDATHKFRSINTLAGMTAIFVGCGLVLMGDQGHVAVGTELLAVGVVGLGTFLHGFRQAYRYGSAPSMWRLAASIAIYALQLAGSIVLIAGHRAGIYLAAVALLVNTAFLISAAWLLVVGVYGSRLDEPVSDRET